MAGPLQGSAQRENYGIPAPTVRIVAETARRQKAVSAEASTAAG
jgi:hypothetical protein